MRSLWSFYFVVLCALAFGYYVIVSIPEFGMPMKPVLPIMLDLSVCFRGFEIFEFCKLFASLVCVSIGYTFAYGCIGWFLCRVFPIGSPLEMLQAWDVLPLLLPLLELSESTMYAVSNVNMISPYIAWPFFIGWLQGVHFIAYWATFFLLLCSMIYAALLQLSGRSSPSLKTKFSLEQQLRASETEIQKLRDQNEEMHQKQQQLSQLFSKVMRVEDEAENSQILSILKEIQATSLPKQKKS